MMETTGIFESLQECRDTRVLTVRRWPRLAAHKALILCHRISGNFLYLMIHIETVSELQVFSLKHDPLHRRLQCNRRAAPACCVAQWHKCFFVLSCESCIICSRSVPAGLNCCRVWKLDPHGSLDPALNPPDFYLLAEAAVSAITAWHCSRFCQASRLKSHLPLLGQRVPLFRFGLRRNEARWLPLCTSPPSHPAACLPACLDELSFSSRGSLLLISAGAAAGVRGNLFHTGRSWVCFQPHLPRGQTQASCTVRHRLPWQIGWQKKNSWGKIPHSNKVTPR